MCNHQASEQLIGYLYQVKYALFLLLEKDNPLYKISIEKFDDVAFEEEGTPKELIQLKHHVGTKGSLSNASVDLWRTLKVWMDAITENDSLIKETNFLLITTSVAPHNSAAYYLRDFEERNTKSAYDLLKDVAEGYGNSTNYPAYDLFLQIDESKMLSLLNKIIILDCSANIIDVDKKIRHELRYSCASSAENFVFERLEGWWFSSSIEALLSDNPVYINQKQIRDIIVQFSQEYSENNLPIDEDILNINGIDENDIPVKQRIFLEQLRLLNVSDNRLKLALNDYYRAFQQRSRWIRDDLLYINELENYERRLIDAWNDAFEWMCDEIDDDGIDDEDEIIRRGKSLYREIMKQEILIRPLCGEPFVMKGSYQILANSLKVGWHKDFINRLSYLLCGEDL